MAPKAGFPPNDVIALLLSNHVEEPEQPGGRKAWDRAVIASRFLKMCILFVTAAAIIFADLLVGNASALFANATAYLVGTSAPQDGAQSMPTIQSTADAQALPPIANEAPPGDEIATALKTSFESRVEDGQPPAEALLKQFQAWAAEEETREEITAAFEPADQSQTEIRQPPAEALLKQFQAWAAEEGARARVPPVELVPDTQAQVQEAQAAEVQNARAEVRPIPKRRQAGPLQKVRAQVRPVKNARATVVKIARAQVKTDRAQVRGVQNVRVQVRPQQNALAHDGSVQNAETQWPERRFGWLY